MTHESRKMDPAPLVALALIVVLIAGGAWFLRPVCVADICFGETVTPTADNIDPAQVAAVLPQAPSQELPLQSSKPARNSEPQLPLAALQWQADPAAPGPTEGEVGATPTESEPTIYETEADATWEIADPGDDALVQTVEGDRPAVNRAAAAAERKAIQAEALAELAETALWDPDEQRRGQAIHAVGLQRHKSEALAVLGEVAAMDWDPANRFDAIRSLWSAAADETGDGAEIKAVLEASLGDADESVAQLAQQALDDLAALEAHRAADD